jgi:hypothetical protein
MVNKPKQKGTAAETAVVRYAREHGFPLADRLTLTGRYDRGDVLLCPGAVIEVKAGKAAQYASYGQILAWMEETRTEMRNGHADTAALIIQRQGMGLTRVGLWEFWYDVQYPWPALACRTVDDGLRMLRWSGWGNPLGE